MRRSLLSSGCFTSSCFLLARGMHSARAPSGLRHGLYVRNGVSETGVLHEESGGLVRSGDKLCSHQLCRSCTRARLRLRRRPPSRADTLRSAPYIKPYGIVMRVAIRHPPVHGETEMAESKMRNAFARDFSYGFNSLQVLQVYIFLHSVGPRSRLAFCLLGKG